MKKSRFSSPLTPPPSRCNTNVKRSADARKWPVGDSLSAMRLIAAIKTSVNVDLSVPTVFEAPTVKSLSQRLEADAISVQELARFRL